MSQNPLLSEQCWWHHCPACSRPPHYGIQLRLSFSFISKFMLFQGLTKGKTLSNSKWELPSNSQTVITKLQNHPKKMFFRDFRMFTANLAWVTKSQGTRIQAGCHWQQRRELARDQYQGCCVVRTIWERLRFSVTPDGFRKGRGSPTAVVLFYCSYLSRTK